MGSFGPFRDPAGHESGPALGACRPVRRTPSRDRAARCRAIRSTRPAVPAVVLPRPPSGTGRRSRPPRAHLRPSRPGSRTAASPAAARDALPPIRGEAEAGTEKAPCGTSPPRAPQSRRQFRRRVSSSSRLCGFPGSRKEGPEGIIEPKDAPALSGAVGPVLIPGQKTRAALPTRPASLRGRTVSRTAYTRTAPRPTSP